MTLEDSNNSSKIVYCTKIINLFKPTGIYYIQQSVIPAWVDVVNLAKQEKPPHNLAIV